MMRGKNQIIQACIPYIPTIGDKNQKTAMFGDQGFQERGTLMLTQLD